MQRFRPRRPRLWRAARPGKEHRIDVKSEWRSPWFHVSFPTRTRHGQARCERNQTKLKLSWTTPMNCLTMQPTLPLLFPLQVLGFGENEVFDTMNVSGPSRARQGALRTL